ncbi:MAG TPA: HAD-IA family hydrolase [Steroidobacteraceae bacterium]|nr:HAD-IA family hydrolase [Steroidobacteraceae bacterium]
MTRSEAAPLRAVLFDLDGTLLDTAPDMHRALNALLAEQNRAALPLAAVRPRVSHGAAGVVRVGFAEAGEAQFRMLQRRFLEIYAAALCVETTLFAGMDAVFDGLAARRLAAGVVTNKAARFTEPLLQQLGLRARLACVVSGDTVAQRKPHPLPLLHAAELLGAAPGECIYAGDAERDVQAAHAAGMQALIARYGYLHADDDADAWGGDGDVAAPVEILAWIDRSGRL